MAELELIGGAASNYVWTVRIALAEKGVPYRHTAAMPHKPEVDAIHPFGKIPVMRHGDVTLAESRAICGYIDRVFDGPPLIPAGPVEAAQVEQWISIVNTHIDPVWVRQYLRGYVFPGTADGSPDRAGIDAALSKMQQQVPIMNRAVAGGHLVGDAFTLADINFLPMLFYLSKFPEGGAMLAKAANLAAYLDRHIRRLSIRDSMPQQLPGQSARAAATTTAGAG